MTTPDQTTYDDRAGGLIRLRTLVPIGTRVHASIGPAMTGDRYRIATFGGGPGRSVIVAVDTTRPAGVRSVARNGETVWSEEVRYPADEGPEAPCARARVDAAVTRAEEWMTAPEQR